MARAAVNTEERLSILTQPGAPVLAQIAVTFAVLLTAWAMRRRSRHALSQLNDWQLADVGLTRDEAAQEASRVFWKA